MNLLTFLKGAAIGAGFMYLFDPSQGRRRRARIRDKAVHAWNEAGDTVEAKTRDLGNRAQGLLHDAATILSPSDSNRFAGFSRRNQAWMPANWSPTTRLLITAGAGLLAFYGKRRGDMLGTALGAVSVGVITNTVSRRELQHGIGSPSLPTDYSDSDDGNALISATNLGEHMSRASRSS
jgi:hypothetical protein